ncbi:helix-turn-helix domain-containing protein [Bacteroides uniformis]|nr:helix-turn-helix domain-containing protein [Bacteroides uniformis]
MLRAYKYRIYPTNEQKALFAKTFGCCRFVYNWALNFEDNRI